ncbi:MAG: DedA family protein [Phenylobacterium sp.]|nr:DedA family protein [Phenylobacterium sp.]
MEHLISQYGALGVFLGAAVEGQSAVVAGGLLARQHLMSLWIALACATSGSGLADQMLFIAGRRFRDTAWVARTTARPAFAKALGFIERYPNTYVLAFRFVYGLRLVSPLAIGVSRMPAWRFAGLNLLAAALWAAVFTGLGYAFGEAVEAMLGSQAARRGAMIAAVALVLLVLVGALVRMAMRRAGPRQAG